MIAAAVTKEYGVLATDSASYSTEDGRINFENQKLSAWNGKYLVAFLGTALYFSRIDPKKFSLPMDELSLYLQEHFKLMRPDVENLMKESITDADEQKAHFCLYVLGVHGKCPTIAQFNSFQDFAPKYLWARDGETVKFTTLLYGDDSIQGKAQIFKDATKYMEGLAQKKIGDLTPGLVGEILTRGIYKKADLEEKIGLKKKYAGGIVCAGVVKADGSVSTLSNVEVVNGR